MDKKRTQNTEHRIQNTEHRSQSTEHRYPFHERSRGGRKAVIKSETQNAVTWVVTHDVGTICVTTRAGEFDTRCPMPDARCPRDKKRAPQKQGSNLWDSI